MSTKVPKFIFVQKKRTRSRYFYLRKLFLFCEDIQEKIERMIIVSNSFENVSVYDDSDVVIDTELIREK